MFLRFNAYNTHTHALMHARMHAPCTHACIHTESYIRAIRLKKMFSKGKVLKEDLKEVAEWQTETGSWFQITGAW